jgi:hypothetical protein
VSISSYATLKASVANWLNRTDLTSEIAEFVQLAEAEFRRDDRLRKMQDAGNFSITADGDTLPTDFLSLESLTHDGSSYYGEIEIRPVGDLPALKGLCGTVGVPQYAAIVDGTLSYAPEPDTTYTARLVYWRKITALSDSNTSNWLLADHPDVYLWGTLMQAAPFLKDDERIPVWEGKLEKALAAVHNATWNAQYSGKMTRRASRPIGG